MDELHVTMLIEVARRCGPLQRAALAMSSSAGRHATLACVECSTLDFTSMHEGDHKIAAMLLTRLTRIKESMPGLRALTVKLPWGSSHWSGDCEDSVNLLKKLATLTGLQYLNLSEHGSSLIDRGLAALTALTGLRTLLAAECRITVADAAVAAAALKGLTRLDLSGSSIGDAGAAALAVSATRLRDLSISSVGMTNAGAAALGASLSELESLNVSSNEIGGTTGVCCLARLPCLQHLDLAHCGVGDEGAAAVAAAAPVALRSLNLFGNGIGDTGALALARLIGLEALNVCNNPIGGTGIRALVDSLGDAVEDDGFVQRASGKENEGGPVLFVDHIGLDI